MVFKDNYFELINLSFKQNNLDSFNWEYEGMKFLFQKHRLNSLRVIRKNEFVIRVYPNKCKIQQLNKKSIKSNKNILFNTMRILHQKLKNDGVM